MKNLEMFEMKKTNLSLIKGGLRAPGSGSKKVTDSGLEDPNDGYSDGYYDANGNGQNDCGETQWMEYTSTCD